jgi:hypothetical protein
MTKYLVVGEYGPIGGMSVELEVEATTPEEAFDKFCATIEADMPHTWDRMGRRNVSVLHEVKEAKAEPVVPKSVWEVKFVGRMTPYKVHALTFIEAVEEAKKVAVEIGEAETNIKAVTYLMY